MNRKKMLALVVILLSTVLSAGAKEITDTLNLQKLGLPEVASNFIEREYTSSTTGITYRFNTAVQRCHDIIPGTESERKWGINFGTEQGGIYSVSNPNGLKFKGITGDIHRSYVTSYTNAQFEVKCFLNEVGNATYAGASDYRESLGTMTFPFLLDWKAPEDEYLAMGFYSRTYCIWVAVELVMIWDDGEPEEVTPPVNPEMSFSISGTPLSAEEIEASAETPIEVDTAAILRVECDEPGDLMLHFETPETVLQPLFNEDILLSTSGHHVLTVRRPTQTADPAALLAESDDSDGNEEVENPDTSAYEDLMALHLNVKDPSTGIIATETTSGPTVLYDLQGRRIEGTPAPGIYIDMRQGQPVKRIIR